MRTPSTMYSYTYLWACVGDTGGRGIYTLAILTNQVAAFSITRHRSLCLRVLLWDRANSCNYRLRTLRRPQIRGWQYMEFVVRAKNDCKTAECDEDLNIPGQHSLNQPNSLNNTPCQKGYVTLHISLGEDRCFCVASEELRDSSSVLVASLWLHSLTNLINHPSVPLLQHQLQSAVVERVLQSNQQLT